MIQDIKSKKHKKDKRTPDQKSMDKLVDEMSDEIDRAYIAYKLTMVSDKKLIKELHSRNLDIDYIEGAFHALDAMQEEHPTPQEIERLMKGM